jgi:hypothetical protein
MPQLLMRLKPDDREHHMPVHLVAPHEADPLERVERLIDVCETARGRRHDALLHGPRIALQPPAVIGMRDRQHEQHLTELGERAGLIVQRRELARGAERLREHATTSHAITSATTPTVHE